MTPLDGSRVGHGHAPGKTILAGEHFVVHGAPALAVPVRAVGKQVRVALHGQADAPQRVSVGDPHSDHSVLLEMIRCAVAQLAIAVEHVDVAVESTLAPGAHLGSSAALAVALVRALAEAEGRELDDREVARVALELERIVHGNPSGIDNTVVALDRPIAFRRGWQPVPFEIAVQGVVLLADTGEASSTAEIVAGVGRFREADPERFEGILARAESVATTMREALARGEALDVGRAMTENHALLGEIGTSAPSLDRLVTAALDAGADGAKLTGAGGGGNMIALTTGDRTEAVRGALVAAGAVGVIDLALPLERRP